MSTASASQSKSANGADKAGRNPLARLFRRKAGASVPPDPPADEDKARGNGRSTALLAAYGLLMLGFAGVVGWLAVNAPDTIAKRQAAIPEIRVDIAGGLSTATPTNGTADQEGTPATDSPRPQQPAQHGGVQPTAPHLPVIEPPVTLTVAPVPGLVEESPRGPLPRIAADGRKPWQIYARPFPASDTRPRIAILMMDMGQSGMATGNALQKLPPTVSFAFTPFAERLDDWVEQSRGKGHEVLLSVPMEPIAYPRDDPGPNALLTSLPPDQNVERLEWALGRTVGYVGITTTSGSKFTGTSPAMRVVIETLRDRGLMYVDPRLTPRSVGGTLAGEVGVPLATLDRVIDAELSRGAIDEQLRDLEGIARNRGAALAFASPYPTTIERLSMWLATVADRGIAIVPVSAIADRQKP